MCLQKGMQSLLIENRDAYAHRLVVRVTETMAAIHKGKAARFPSHNEYRRNATEPHHCLDAICVRAFGLVPVLIHVGGRSLPI